MEHLLRNRANASKRDKQGYSPVHYAAARGHKLALEMVQLVTSHIFLIVPSSPCTVLHVCSIVKV